MSHLNHSSVAIPANQIQVASSFALPGIHLDDFLHSRMGKHHIRTNSHPSGNREGCEFLQIELFPTLFQTIFPKKGCENLAFRLSHILFRSLRP